MEPWLYKESVTHTELTGLRQRNRNSVCTELRCNCFHIKQLTSNHSLIIICSLLIDPVCHVSLSSCLMLGPTHSSVSVNRLSCSAINHFFSWDVVMHHVTLLLFYGVCRINWLKWS